MFGKTSESTIEKSLPALPTPPYDFYESSSLTHHKINVQILLYTQSLQIKNLRNKITSKVVWKQFSA
jgi:hypothetical protein